MQPSASSADADEDAEEWYEELKELGADPEQLATLRQQIDDQAEDDEDEDGEDDDFALWPCNNQAFGVFARCKWTRIVAGDRFLTEGIEAREIEAVMNMLAVPAPDRPETLDLVRHAEKAVLPMLNRK